MKHYIFNLKEETSKDDAAEKEEDKKDDQKDDQEGTKVPKKELEPFSFTVLYCATRCTILFNPVSLFAPDCMIPFK